MASFLFSVALYSLLLLAVILVVFLVRLNTAMTDAHPEGKRLSPHRWTEDEIRETYARIEQEDREGRGQEYIKEKLPPKLGRRYVVTGGSGLVGSAMMELLILRGESPEAIRVLDIREPEWLASAKGVQFISTDITSLESVQAAYARGWPDFVAKSPLTTIHIAAMLKFEERSLETYGPIRRVNVEGTQHLLTAARDSPGSDVFIAVASSSIAARPPRFWSWRVLFKGEIPGWFSAFDESDAYKPIRAHEEFFSNYGASKAEAERLVMAAGQDSTEHLKTGVIRPGNGIFGGDKDLTLSMYLRFRNVPTLFLDSIQNYISIASVGLSILLLESALLSPQHGGKITGRTFLVSDPGPAPFFRDMLFLLETLAETPFKSFAVPPVPMFLLSYSLEAYSTAIFRYPVLKKLGLKPLSGNTGKLAPSMFTVMRHLYCIDTEARKPVAEGGIGLGEVQGENGGGMTTMEGMCRQLLRWNQEHTVRDRERSSPNGEMPLGEEVEKASAVVAGDNDA